MTINIQSAFQSLSCTATSGTLGAASTIQLFGNFPHAELRNTWYPVALANKMAGDDLSPGATNTNADDIVAVFNSDLGKASCLPSLGWYYGLDGNHGSNIDLVTVLLHEFAHGLGFAGYYDKTTGAQLQGFPDIYGTYTYSTTFKKAWPKLNDAQRRAATVDTNHVVWIGKNVLSAAPHVLQSGTPLVTVNVPASLGSFAVGTATFGAPLTSPGVKGNVILAKDADEDGSGGESTATDGCSAISTSLRGKIALIDRGVCNFVDKVKNAQDAGAIGVIIADNVGGSPPPGSPAPIRASPSPWSGSAWPTATSCGSRRPAARRRRRSASTRASAPAPTPRGGCSSTPPTRSPSARRTRTGTRSPSPTC